MATYNEEVTINDNLIVDGTNDETQVRVQAHTTQNNPLQTWEDSSAATLLQVTEDGRFKVGDEHTLQANNALIEVYREGTSTGKPERGINTLGTVEGALSNPVDWVAHELEISGSVSDTVTSVHSAVKGQVTHQNSGDSSGATLRGGEFKVVNEVGASGTPVGEAVGLHADVSNASGASLDKAVGVDVTINNSGTINDAIGLEVADVNQGSNNNFAIRTGIGQVRLGDLGGSGNKLVMVDNDGDLGRATPGTDYLEPDSVTGDLQSSDFPALTGDVTTSGGSLVTTIASNAVTSAKIASNAVTSAKIKTSTGSGTTSLSNVDVTMNDYSFFPNIEKDTCSGLIPEIFAYNGNSLNNAVGRFNIANRINNNPQYGPCPTGSYRWTWRYITSSRDQEIFAIWDTEKQIIRAVWASEIEYADVLPFEMREDYLSTWIPVQLTVFDAGLTKLGERPDTNDIYYNYTITEVVKASEIADTHPLKADKIAYNDAVLKANSGDETQCFKFITHPDVYYGRLEKDPTARQRIEQVQAAEAMAK